MSTASITSRASASASLAHLHKYERPMQKYTLDQALAGCDMSSALSQIRTSKTRAKADNSPLAEELECHERCLTSGQELVLSRMVLFELQVAFAHEKQIRNKLEGGQLPAPNFAISRSVKHSSLFLQSARNFSQVSLRPSPHVAYRLGMMSATPRCALKSLPMRTRKA